MSKAAIDFLNKHGMLSDRIDPIVEAGRMRDVMEKGLCGDAVLPMIPTYLQAEEAVSVGESAIVIDAGGTNFRCGLITFTENGPQLTHMYKTEMPGIVRPASWEEFIGFIADAVEPLTPYAQKIGFCFSYTAVITPEIDGRVIRIDKEVDITGSEGRLVGASLLEELEKRGIKGKRIVILNDTAAVLLGGSATIDWNRCGGLIGQVSGTGTNTCCVLPLDRIQKLGRPEKTRIIVNLESGMYDGMPRGDFDFALDELSHNPGEKLMEKLTAGVYLGQLFRLILHAAVKEGMVSLQAWDAICSFGSFNASMPDAWAVGSRLDVFDCEEDRDFIRTVARELFVRSARAMCSNLLAILLLTGEGKDPERPVVICAEGSLVQKGRCYRPALEDVLYRCASESGLFCRLQIGEETTLPGAAVAAVLNC